MEKESFREFRDELEYELTGNILPWWMKYTPDQEHGGFHGHITHKNEVVKGAGKGAIMNTRILWTFSATYRMYPDPSYLDTAERAYRYIIDHFLDREFGGVYWELDYQGRVKSDRKQIYAIAFAIYALAEYHMAFNKPEALDAAIHLFHDIEEYALDKEKNGYAEALSRNWETLEDMRLSEKDDNESKTMNTHLHILEAYGNLYRVWKDPALKHALENLIKLFLEKFVDAASHHLNLFFDDDWKLKSTLVSYGHDIECSWLLHEAAEILGEPGLIKRSGEMAVRMARASVAGLDEDGGLFYEYFPEKGELDTDKHWWPQAEAMVGYYNAYQLSGDEDFLEHALQSWEFIFNYICDWMNDEWYWSVDKEGNPQTEKEKAGFWKCPYHNGRTCMEIIRRIDIELKQSI
ncbi:MAG: AGE family epimerase/isomerase [Bacteroidota bacterium]